ncbi:MAG: hypothetical protein H7834_15520 [Magnetococcus sp. YQC-9]
MTATAYELVLDWQASNRFAQLSGDFNPLHLDAEDARRMRFGTTVVHGMHLCLSLLENWCVGVGGRLRLVAVKGEFNRPVPSGRAVEVHLREQSPGRAAWMVRIGGQKACTLRVEYVEEPLQDSFPQATCVRYGTLTPGVCRIQAIGTVSGLKGKTPLMMDPELLEGLFPALAHGVHPDMVAMLLAATRVVGMECPGQAALFASFRMHAGETSGYIGAPEADFEVRQMDERIGQVALTLSGAGIEGGMEAFFSDPIVRQPCMAEIADRLGVLKFTNVHAWIIGGSRGLGETTAKIIAAGGGRVAIGYHLGERDARRVQTEIREYGGTCEIFRHNVLNPDGSPPWSGVEAMTHLFYFASPKILLNPWNRWQQERFDDYCSYYVRGFLETVIRNASHPDHVARGVKVFYPSTVFLDRQEPGVLEYIAAKAAGEVVCRGLGRDHPWIVCEAVRLEPLLTDQTASRTTGVEETLSHLLAVLQRYAVSPHGS